MTKPSENLYGAEHVARYQATDGEEGYIWKRGTTILLLTTVGRKSGETRTTPLIYREVDGSYVIVASKGGAPEHPGWYLNLKDKPVVDLQIKGDRFKARARDADATEHAELWPKMSEVWPDYDEYQAKTDRQIPIVVLERQ
jgi:deazaflavin-dependent oxidoreductase (nitroreductase family)